MLELIDDGRSIGRNFRGDRHHSERPGLMASHGSAQRQDWTFCELPGSCAQSRSELGFILLLIMLDFATLIGAFTLQNGLKNLLPGAKLDLQRLSLAIEMC
jgi:hypothetical protein